MKVRHCYSLETFDLSEPQYTKLDGVYGLLVMGGKNIFFITDAEQNSFYRLTSDFIIL